MHATGGTFWARFGMGRTFHNLHVYASSQRMRDRVVRIVLAYAKQQGYERTTSTRSSDRVIRIGGRVPWLTIEDDGYEIEAIGNAIASSLRTPILEAYCEASAHVGLGLRLGRTGGGWGWGHDRLPPARAVEAILDEGTAADFAQAWQEGARQVFPETALAVAAHRFGIDTGILFGDKRLRGTTLALRRRRPSWKPTYRTGAPAFEIGWGSNQSWGLRHLVFEDELVQHRVHVTSVGGPGRGLAIRFGGTAIDGGHVEIVDVRHEALAFVREGDTWRDANANVPAGLVELPDTFVMPRGERDKVDRVTGRLEWHLDVTYRACTQGECQLRTFVESQGHVSEGALDLMVMWKPWRPSVAHAHVDNHKLFQLHRRDHVVLHVALRGSLADAWAWAQPHVAAWAEARGERYLRVQRDNDIVLDERTGSEAGTDEPLPWNRVAAYVPDPRTPLQVRGASYRFGTCSFAPWRLDPRESLAVQLVLWAESGDDDGEETLAALTAVADDAFARGVACSAVLAEQQYAGDERTGWEDITVTDDNPLRLAAWHDTHVRGVDKRIWMSAEHARRIDRAAVARHAEVTDLGRGIRITMDPERPRRELEPLIAILGSLLPSQASVEAFKLERAAQLALSAPAAMTAERVIDERT